MFEPSDNHFHKITNGNRGVLSALTAVVGNYRTFFLQVVKSFVGIRNRFSDNLRDSVTGCSRFPQESKIYIRFESVESEVLKKLDSVVSQNILLSVWFWLISASSCLYANAASVQKG